MKLEFSGQMVKFSRLKDGRVIFIIESDQKKMKPSSPVPAFTLAKIEEDHIRSVLAESSSLAEAAETLGINLSTLWRKRREYNLE